MSDAIDKTGNLAQAMEHAQQLLDHDLQQATLQLEEILAAVPARSRARSVLSPTSLTPADFLQAMV